jgi:predicted nucleotidyltransferase component of viral defense system
MLSLDQIKKYYPDHLKGFERFMLREYLQYKILEILYESDFANRFSFIGGTSLRIVHGNRRFSEDLDFDNFEVTANEFHEIVEILKKGLELEGYQAEFRSVLKAAYHCHIRFPRLLYDNGLSGHSEEKIFIRLDTEAQHYDFVPERHLINKFDVFTEIKTTPADILLAQKFLTIINRKQNKGRDFYDVVFLLGQNVQPNFDFLSRKASITRGSELKEAVLTKVKSLDLNYMAQDVKPYLINPKEIKQVELFEKYIRQYAFEK